MVTVLRALVIIITVKYSVVSAWFCNFVSVYFHSWVEMNKFLIYIMHLLYIICIIFLSLESFLLWLNKPTTLWNHRVHMSNSFLFSAFFKYKHGKWSCSLRINILTFTVQFEPLWNIKLNEAWSFRGSFFSKTREICPSSADYCSQERRRVSFNILRRESWVISVPPDYFWKLFLLHWPESKPPK